MIAGSCLADGDMEKARAAAQTDGAWEATLTTLCGTPADSPIGLFVVRDDIVVGPTH